MKMSIAVAVALVATAGPALAYDATWTRYDEANANLSAAYDAAIAHRQGADRIALRNDERVWISTRNKTCGFETKGRCSIELSERRTRYLVSLIPNPTVYKSMSSPRLLSLQDALFTACREPGQDADGPICGGQEAAYAELQRRGLKN